MEKRGRPRHPDILTPREWQVLRLLRRGCSNREIAARLGISPGGAKYHVGEILSKLGAASRRETALLRLSDDDFPFVTSASATWRPRRILCDNRDVDNRPIGVFDSGVGGLTIWRAMRKLLPQESLIFLADSGHVPYGEKSTVELHDLTERIARFLLDRDVKMIVVACNTATVHSIGHLRETFPETPFVGVVPVVKTLARLTRTGTIAVMSTPATAGSPYLAGLIEEFAPDKRVINVGCDGLEDLVESGKVRTRQTTALLERHLEPVRGSAADVVGLGCTHYPFLRNRIKRLLGPGVRVYDPSRPVARRVRQLLVERDALAQNESPAYEFYTTGDTELFASVASKLLRFPVHEAGFADI
ncbi:MAG: glutamate racemase [Dehalococcoidia bacterium]